VLGKFFQARENFPKCWEDISKYGKNFPKCWEKFPKYVKIFPSVGKIFPSMEANFHVGENLAVVSGTMVFQDDVWGVTKMV